MFQPLFTQGPPELAVQDEKQYQESTRTSNKMERTLEFYLLLRLFFDYADTLQKSYEKLYSFSGLVISLPEGLVAMFKNL